MRVSPRFLIVLTCAIVAWGQPYSRADRVQLPSLRINPANQNQSAVRSSPALIVNPSTCHFGETAVGTPLRHSFELINNSKQIVIGTVEGQEMFRAVSNSPYTLGPGEIRSVTVEFVPQRSGSFSGLVTFRGEYSTLSIVAGTATAAPVLIAPAPLSGPAFPEIIVLGGGTSFQVQWRAEAGKQYQVWYSEDLVGWRPGGPPVVAPASVASFVDDGSVTVPAPVGVQARFYRVGDSNSAIVGFRRVQLAADTPLSVPFLKPIAAQGTIASVAARSVTLANGSFRSNQFRFDAATQPLTYVMAVTSGANAGRWFAITGNDASTIQLDDLEATIDLRQLLRVGDSCIIYPLHRIADVFGPPSHPVLSRDDRIFLWDVSSQAYEPPISLDVIPPDTRLAWAQEARSVDNLPLFPGEGMLVKRNAPGKAELLLAGAVPFTPMVQEVVAGNNLVGQPFPVSITVSRSDLLASGFAGGHSFSTSDKLYLFNTRRANFKTALWYNTLLDRWMSPVGELDPSQTELAPATSFFIQRNQVRGFEWIQKPVDSER